ncbi:hypothetical protein RIF29_21368 [Crotalaria pallida]|uniref:Uncharacterized protein n=1 Tax=Crotalaria pallida TaxID=3830 RepID=A0AAN9F774_CROPI
MPLGVFDKVFRLIFMLPLGQSDPSYQFIQLNSTQVKAWSESHNSVRRERERERQTANPGIATQFLRSALCSAPLRHQSNLYFFLKQNSLS